MVNATTSDLWTRIQDGDEGAFEVVFKGHYAELCGFANRFTTDPDQSEDLVQEVFFKIWKSASTLDLKQGIRPYLFQSVRNASLNYLKHEGVKRAHAALHPAEEGREEKHAEVRELEERIDFLIGRLPEKCRVVFRI